MCGKGKASSVNFQVLCEANAVFMIIQVSFLCRAATSSFDPTFAVRYLSEYILFLLVAPPWRPC